MTRSYIPSSNLTGFQGTPKYIARSVSLGKVLVDPIAFSAKPMPELTGEAKDLYLKAYGEERYNRYADQLGPDDNSDSEVRAFVKKFPHLFPKGFVPGRTVHGGCPPLSEEETYDDIPFNHRPEHDVESVWWTMLSALVRVQPANRPQEDFVPPSLNDLWESFSQHAILADPSPLQDLRGNILARSLKQWLSYFAPFPELEDVGRLLHAIACQVRCEYALWDPQPPHPDHLHEAVQRLILQYLVDHKDQDVKLTGNPTRLRPVDKKPETPDSKVVKADGTTPKTKNFTFVEEDPSGASTSQPSKRKSQSRNSGTQGAPKTKRRKGGNDDDAAVV